MKHQREDAVSTMIGKQLGTIRRLFDRDRPFNRSRENPFGEEGGGGGGERGGVETLRWPIDREG